MMVSLYTAMIGARVYPNNVAKPAAVSVSLAMSRLSLYPERLAICRIKKFSQSHGLDASDGLRCFVHLSCAKCPFRAVVLVNSAPHLGQ